MTKPIPYKTEIALEYPEKLYIGTFECSPSTPRGRNSDSLRRSDRPSIRTPSRNIASATSVDLARAFSLVDLAT